MRRSALSALIGDRAARHLAATAFGREVGRYCKVERSRCGIEAITWPWVWSLLDVPWLTYPRLRLAVDGVPVPLARYVLQRRVFPLDPASDESEVSPAAVRKEFEQGCTLVIDRIETFLPRWKRFTASLAQELQCDTLTNVYASDGKKRGFDLHADSCDNLVIQVDGSKKWLLYPRVRNLNDPVDENIASIATIVLEAGQCLYIPRGTPHRVLPTGRPTIHAGIALVPFTKASLLKWAAERLEYHIDPEGDGRLPLGVGRPGMACEIRRRLRSDMAQMLDGVDVEAFLRDRSASAPFGRM